MSESSKRSRAAWGSASIPLDPGRIGELGVALMARLIVPVLVALHETFL